ncbi:hypothetical protein TWF506_009739 [Arthrobotrys conoides]|uniref:Uncharacterized protein n=1 Tax=Arthrobotrys conoides TaxID=74498 RepID=A0AAN8NA09_9PEZI
MNAYVDDILRRSDVYHAELDVIIGSFSTVDTDLNSYSTQSTQIKQALGPYKANMADAMMRGSSWQPPAEAKNWGKVFQGYIDQISSLENQVKAANTSYQGILRTADAAFGRASEVHGPIPTYENHGLEELSANARKELTDKYRVRQKLLSDRKETIEGKVDRLLRELSLVKHEIQGLKDWLKV